MIVTQLRGVVRFGLVKISYRIVRRIPLTSGCQVQAIVNGPSTVRTYVVDAHSLAEAFQRLGDEIDALVREADPDRP